MSEHVITREAQPIADQWMLRCSCGWSKAIDLNDPKILTVDDIRVLMDTAEVEHTGTIRATFV